MQPIEAQEGVSPKSQFFNSLKVYLNNKNRLQPIIGLGSIIECVKAGTHNREALYLCEVCVCRLSKADVRIHIMGSLHRYNYIKAWHPNLVPECKENSDLSKLAWPLMELATMLECKEGPGDVQLFEVEDAVYQRMATRSENDAVTLINILRDEQGEPESHSETVSVRLEHCPIQSQRTVLLAQNEQRRSKKSCKTSAETNKPPSLIQSAVSPVKSEGWFNNSYSSLSDNTQTSPFSDLSENNSFLDGYTGTTPLIGLLHVVECRSEDGHTYCFLCHCCRIRSNKKDIIDHLTSSSHLLNYLMETHPEQMEVLMTDSKDNYQLLQSLAKKVEQDEGRGELTVVNAPESLCILLTSKSYHWWKKKTSVILDTEHKGDAPQGLEIETTPYQKHAVTTMSEVETFTATFYGMGSIKMLCSGSMHTNIQKSKTAVKGPGENKTSNQGMPGKCAVEWPKRMPTKRKMRKVSNTVFKVSLPITERSVLLERTPFSVDSLPVPLAYSRPIDSHRFPSPEDCEVDCDTGSFSANHAEHTSVCTTTQLQQDLYTGDADSGQCMGPERNFVSHYQEVDGCFSDIEYFNQSEYLTGTKDLRFYGESNYSRQHGSQESPRKMIYKDWQNEGQQRQNEWLSPAVSHTQGWSSYNSSYGSEEGCTGQWYNLTSQSKADIRVDVSRQERQKEMSSDVTQHDCQQQPQDQYRDHASPLTGSVEQHGWYGELAPCSYAAWMNMHPHVGDFFAQSGNIVPEPRVVSSE